MCACYIQIFQSFSQVVKSFLKIQRLTKSMTPVYMLIVHMYQNLNYIKQIIIIFLPFRMLAKSLFFRRFLIRRMTSPSSSNLTMETFSSDTLLFAQFNYTFIIYIFD